MCVVKAYVVELSNKHAQQEATEKNTNPQVFVPASDEPQAIEEEEWHGKEICQ